MRRRRSATGDAADRGLLSDLRFVYVGTDDTERDLAAGWTLKAAYVDPGNTHAIR